MLTNEEVLALKSFLVRDNERVTRIVVERGYMGLGGSNRSGFCADSERTRIYDVEWLNGKETIWVSGDEICALVNDVLYLRYTNKDGERKVWTVSHEKDSATLIGEEIAYDTVSAERIELIIKQ